jgi:hypothetical protein
MKTENEKYSINQNIRVRESLNKTRPAKKVTKEDDQRNIKDKIEVSNKKLQRRAQARH